MYTSLHGNIVVDSDTVLHTRGTQDLKEILKDLNSASDDILLSMIATSDGLTITSLSSSDHDIQNVGAMCTELLTVCSRSAKELQQGYINEMFLRCSETNILLVPSGNMIVLALITRQDINLGLLLIEADRAKQAIKSCF